VLVTYAYDAFGAIRSETGSSSNYWKFTGEQRDSESGFDFLRARYYDPAVGRFLSSDPLGGGGYPYAGNNPANATDPTGLYPFGGMTVSDFCLFGEGDDCVRSYTFTGEIDIHGNVTEFEVTGVGLQSGAELGPEDLVACYGRGANQLCSLPNGDVVDPFGQPVGALSCGGWDYLDHGCDVAMACYGADCDARFGVGAEMTCKVYYCAPTNPCPYTQCYQTTTALERCIEVGLVGGLLSLAAPEIAGPTTVRAIVKGCVAGGIVWGLQELGDMF
jgi:RHS repeat-associated protein